MTSASQSSPAGQIGDFLLSAARFHIPIRVGKTHHGIGIPNIDPLRIRTGRIKGDAEGLLQARGKRFAALRLAVFRDAAEYFDHARIALGEEHVAIGRSAELSRILWPTGVKLNFESRRSVGPCILGA